MKYDAQQPSLAAAEPVQPFLYNRVLNAILTYLSKSCDPSVHTHLQFQSSHGQRTKGEMLVHYTNL